MEISACESNNTAAVVIRVLPMMKTKAKIVPLVFLHSKSTEIMST